MVDLGYTCRDLNEEAEKPLEESKMLSQIELKVLERQKCMQQDSIGDFEKQESITAKFFRQGTLSQRIKEKN